MPRACGGLHGHARARPRRVFDGTLPQSKPTGSPGSLSDGKLAADNTRMRPCSSRIRLAFLIAIVMAGCAGDAPGAGAPIRVLFLGNSYTFVNDLPHMFASLAASGGHAVVTTMDAAGGELLQGHAGDPQALALLDQGGWAFVVLQEQSQVPAVEPARSEVMFPAARALAAHARASGATPVFLMTWARQRGWPEARLDYPRMQTRISAAYCDIARELHTPVAPVGQAWQQVRRSHPEIELWQPDGSHPTVAGTYLAACVLHATLFHVSPENLRYTAGLPSTTVRLLQATAAQTVLAKPGLWQTP